MKKFFETPLPKKSVKSFQILKTFLCSLASEDLIVKVATSVLSYLGLRILSYDKTTKQSSYDIARPS